MMRGGRSCQWAGRRPPSSKRKVPEADLDGEGALDVAVSSWRKGNQFTWFENSTGSSQPGEWPKRMIDDNIAAVAEPGGVLNFAAGRRR
jgi:hypothetical protein